MWWMLVKAAKTEDARRWYPVEVDAETLRQEIIYDLAAYKGTRRARQSRLRKTL